MDCCSCTPGYESGAGASRSNAASTGPTRANRASDVGVSTSARAHASTDENAEEQDDVEIEEIDPGYLQFVRTTQAHREQRELR